MCINKKAFTLIEMLVVVLIIGILASIALPQYNKTVEKAKVSEALLNIKAIEESMQRYILTNGFPKSGCIWFEDFADIELSGGELDENDEYITKNFRYSPGICTGSYYMEVYENNSKYDFYIYSENNIKQCFTELTDIGQYICKYLESQGWEYINTEL